MRTRSATAWHLPASRSTLLGSSAHSWAGWRLRTHLPRRGSTSLRPRPLTQSLRHQRTTSRKPTPTTPSGTTPSRAKSWSCLLYTSDAADDLTRVDLGGRRIIKKKKKKKKKQ